MSTAIFVPPSSPSNRRLQELGSPVLHASQATNLTLASNSTTSGDQHCVECQQQQAPPALMLEVAAHETYSSSGIGDSNGQGSSMQPVRSLSETNDDSHPQKAHKIYNDENGSMVDDATVQKPNTIGCDETTTTLNNETSSSNVCTSTIEFSITETNNSLQEETENESNTMLLCRRQNTLIGMGCKISNPMPKISCEEKHCSSETTIIQSIHSSSEEVACILPHSTTTTSSGNISNISGTATSTISCTTVSNSSPSDSGEWSLLSEVSPIKEDDNAPKGDARDDNLGQAEQSAHASSSSKDALISTKEQNDGSQTTLVKTCSTALIPYNPITTFNLPFTSGNANTDQQQQQQQQQQAKIPTHKGLINLGNTCYLNSALQMIMSIDGFVEEIISSYRGYKEEEANISTNEEEAVSSDESNTQQQGKAKNQFPLRDALSEFFISVKEEEDKLASTTGDNNNTLGYKEAINPSKLKSVVDELTPLFVGYFQQDSHEFLSTILDLLHDELARKKDDTYIDESNSNNEQEDTKAEEETNEKLSDKVENTRQDTDVTEEESMSTITENVIEGQSCDMAVSQNTTDGKNDKNDHEDNLIHDENKPPLEKQYQDDEDKNEEWTDIFKESGNDEDSKQLGDVEEYKINTPKKAVEDYVIVGKMDVDDISTHSNEEITQKKARTDSHQHGIILSKVPSLSDFSVEDIGVLLHGDKAETVAPSVPPMRSWASTASRKSEPSGGKLVGGRIEQVSSSALLLQRKEETGDGETNGSNKDLGERSNEAVEEDGENNSMAEETASRHSSSPTCTLVDKYFTTKIRTHLTCDSCKFTRSKEEMHRYLSIDVSPTGDDSQNAHDKSVQEGIRRYFAPEKRELKCEKCFGESASQVMEIARLPVVLILHLKRFIVNYSPCYTNITYSKNGSPVEFGESINFNRDDLVGGNLGEFVATDTELPDSCCRFADEKDHISTVTANEKEEGKEEEGHSYKIRSVINHIGSSASRGHYTADAKRRHEDGREWMRFDDSSVSFLKPEDAMGDSAQKTAYIISYEL